MYAHVYTIGPLQLLLDQMPEEKRQTGGSSFHGYSLLKEQPECFQWLQSKDPSSVIYVNFGSNTVMSLEDLTEFGWGLVNSNYYFLWIIRPDLVMGGTAVFVREFEECIKKRVYCKLVFTGEGVEPWFGWRVLDSLYVCKEWGVGLEMQGSKVTRDEVTRRVQELMGEGGDRIRNKAIEWKEKCRVAAGPNGSSSLNVDKIDIVPDLVSQ
ncbi:hypothetical protein L1987_07483 [Smallanthus sonchifolius]|uniref:Uncharacterized protein n=1 Tax=Smallanthus sonchifolius TaxID=185202 RepID=A0ACB9K0H5_9ASTR|nr:hypothetical protein L1987_07483 [Smallanthus sonchifolius]